MDGKDWSANLGPYWDDGYSEGRGASRGPWTGGKDLIGTEVVIVRVGGTFRGPQAGGRPL